jgi:hypothetical protein
MSDSESNPNNAWLGLLKRSLNYVDGTVPSSESPGFTQMSDEDKSFLEEVMKNGIIDESKRMKEILNSLIIYLDYSSRNSAIRNEKEAEDVISTEEATTLLAELKDIVEQIDYAKSFALMGGLDFLLGAVQTEIVPRPIRVGCLAALSTLSQNNPHVQFMMLERGSIAKLLDLYFVELSQSDNVSNDEAANGLLMSHIVQVISSSVRNHDSAEKLFCMNDSSVKMIESGLGLYQENGNIKTYLALKRKTLFFLDALVTSDTADYDRVNMFISALQFVATNYLDPELERSQELREMSLSMLNRLLEQKRNVNCILDLKNSIVSLGVSRVAELRNLDREEKEFAVEELNLWESLITNMARTPRNKDSKII